MANYHAKCQFSSSIRHKYPPITTVRQCQTGYNDHSRRNPISGRPSRFQYVWTKSCHVISVALGSIWAFIFYWISVGVWVSIGPSLQFSNLWQLYVNTAVAVALTFTSVFLQTIEQQQEDSLEKCLDYALKIDAEIDYHLRDLLEDTKPNPIFEIPPPKINKIESSIERFALIMGSGLEVLISLVFLVI